MESNVCQMRGERVAEGVVGCRDENNGEVLGSVLVGRVGVCANGHGFETLEPSAWVRALARAA